MILDEMFRFPGVMIDGDNEKQKDVLGLPNENELDIAIGEWEIPYFGLIGISDRWMPNKSSFERAIEGDFNACAVTFSNIGTILVPWKKEKFKKEYREFVKKLAPKPQVQIMKLTPEQIKLLESGEGEE